MLFLLLQFPQILLNSLPTQLHVLSFLKTKIQAKKTLKDEKYQNKTTERKVHKKYGVLKETVIVEDNEARNP